MLRGRQLYGGLSFRRFTHPCLSVCLPGRVESRKSLPFLAAAAMGSNLRRMTITPSSLINILSSEHGRQRRAERRISKGDLQAAMRHGKMEIVQSPNPRRGEVQKYTYADMVYIADGNKEVTSWPVPGFGLDVEQVEITVQMKEEHDEACRKIASCPAAWTSHTVIIVDQSGSMRKDDVSEGITRSDAMWLSLAIDLWQIVWGRARRVQLRSSLLSVCRARTRKQKSSSSVSQRIGCYSTRSSTFSAFLSQVWMEITYQL